MNQNRDDKRKVKTSDQLSPRNLFILRGISFRDPPVKYALQHLCSCEAPGTSPLARI